MAAAAVQRDDQGRRRRARLPRLRHVERESAAAPVVVARVEHADPGAVLAERGVAQALDQQAVPPPARLEEPAAHRVEDRSEWIERLLQRGEAPQGAIEFDRLAGVRGGGEGADQLDRLAGDLAEPLAQQAKVLGPRGGLERAQRPGEALGVRRQAIGQLERARRKELPLGPLHAVERAEQGDQQRVGRLRDSRGDRHRARPRGGRGRRAAPGRTRRRASTAGRDARPGRPRAPSPRCPRASPP